MIMIIVISSDNNNNDTNNNKKNNNNNMMIVNLINSTISKLLIYKTYNHNSTPELCTTLLLNYLLLYFSSWKYSDISVSVYCYNYFASLQEHQNKKSNFVNYVIQ